MEEFILKYRKGIIATFFTFVVLGLIGLMGGGTFVSLPNLAIAQTATSSVEVTAVVEAWLDFEISTTTLSISPALVQADGSMNVGETSALDIQLGTNNYLGWQIDIRGENGGLFSSTVGHNILSVSGSSTVATGTEAYGANAQETWGGPGTVVISPNYSAWGTDEVGEIASTTSYTLASKSNPNAKNSVADMVVKATASDITPPAANYRDVITLTAIPIN